MTNTQPLTPTDAELDELRQANSGRLNFVTLSEFRTIARAALAKWGTQTAVVGDPFAWADDGSLRSGSTATAHRVVTNETKKGMPKAAADSFSIPLYTAPQPASQGDALDAARYRYLRDGDWREHEKLESVIRLQLNTLWDETIDTARAAQKGGS